MEMVERGLYQVFHQKGTGGMMEQNSNQLRFPYLLIGSGRLARHLQNYFNLLHIPFLSWSRKCSEPLNSLLGRADKVLLLISDSAIQDFVQTHLRDFHGPVIHMSGALVVPGITWVHPLMTFGDELYDLEFYKQIGFATPEIGAMKALFPELRNSSFVIPDAAKSLYHAWAVIGGNLTSMLAAETLQELQSLNVPPESTKLYLTKSLSNVLEKGSRAVTGPLARKDLVTIQRNMSALNEEQKKLYAAFVEKFAPEVQL